ncbi:MAG TPA: hypothetical protein VLX91_00680 [Candidatus Acidoferrales bacterium]|nr:hypothetical protein [Candidatus Acidoferrales bacterium]
MRKFCRIFFTSLTFLALTAFLSGKEATDWSKIKKLRGRFVITLNNYTSDEKAKALIESSMSGFLVQGEFKAERVPSSGTLLYKGKASGFMCMTHKATVLGDTMVTSEQVCGGPFNDGEATVEIMTDDNQYQVEFEGSVGGKTVISYPLYKAAADLFSQAYDFNTKYHPDWTDDIRIDKGLRDEFTEASKGVDSTEEVTFSAASVPKMVTKPGQKFPDMKFFDLPETGQKIEGSGELQLMVSTTIMPTVTPAACRWIVEAEE